MKIGTVLIALLVAQSASAVENCPTEGKHCRLDPFAGAILSYGVICSGVQPENTKYYRAAVDAVYYGHRKEYKEAIADPDFQRELQELRKGAALVPKSQMDSECEYVLSMGKQAIQEKAPRENIADFGVSHHGQPKDVQSLIDRISACGHWAGEEAYNANRKKEILLAVKRLQCDRLEKDEVLARRRYAKRPEVLKALQEARE